MTTKPPIRMLRLPQVIEVTGLGRDTIYRYIREGRFPAPHRISDRASGWRSDLIQGWIESRPQVRLDADACARQQREATASGSKSAA